MGEVPFIPGYSGLRNKECILRVKLKEKTAVITGASAGIGRETAIEMARLGVQVVIAARRLDKLQTLRCEIESFQGNCLPVATDVSELEQVQRLLNATLEHYGKVDIWINNAGSGLVGSCEQTTADEMAQLMQVNFMGTFFGCQAALQQMRRQKSGHIINISSMAARLPLPLNAAYSATKSAQWAYSKALSEELSGSGIHISTILPSFTETDFTRAMVHKIPDAPGSIIKGTPVSRVAKAIIHCAEHPQNEMILIPIPRIVMAFMDLFPPIWRFAMRKYIQCRTDGKGIQELR
jgi:short-subunit dehydrogenase